MKDIINGIGMFIGIIIAWAILICFAIGILYILVLIWRVAMTILNFN